MNQEDLEISRSHALEANHEMTVIKLRVALRALAEISAVPDDGPGVAVARSIAGQALRTIDPVN